LSRRVRFTYSFALTHSLTLFVCRYDVVCMCDSFRMLLSALLVHARASAQLSSAQLSSVLRSRLPSPHHRSHLAVPTRPDRSRRDSTRLTPIRSDPIRSDHATSQPRQRRTTQATPRHSSAHLADHNAPTDIMSTPHAQHRAHARLPSSPPPSTPAATWSVDLGTTSDTIQWHPYSTAESIALETAHQVEMRRSVRLCGRGPLCMWS
jgi:hypothetical protein